MNTNKIAISNVPQSEKAAWPGSYGSLLYVCFVPTLLG